MRWLRDSSESSVREAVAAAVPALADAPIRMSPPEGGSNPEWAAATARLADAFIVKFAWSEVAAVRIGREAQVLQTLAEAVPGLPVPRVEGRSDEPVAFVTRLVTGSPLHFGGGVSEGARLTAAAQLAAFLATLHEPSVLEAMQTAVPALVSPQPQGSTPDIRARLPRFLDRRRSGLARAWCDVVDDILGAPAAGVVLVHGDLHGFNQVWDRAAWTLRLVADFEVAGPGDAEFDLRYVPPLEPTFAFTTAVAVEYERRTGRALDLNRVMAWHIRTALGDALWRSEAGVALPGDSTPASYVDDIERKLVTVRRETGVRWPVSEP